ncbi:hypothetical protein FQR65_LT05661 [Abscondita terminalis]|nr:hypothetical protein FQR65_LT05661 [Abscondita terminalis]
MSAAISNPPLFDKEMRLLKIFGLSLYDNDSFAYKIYSGFCMIFIIFLYPVIDIMELFRYDFDGMAGIILYATSITVLMFKSVMFYIHSSKFRDIIDCLQQPPFTLDYERGGKKEEKLLKTAVQITTIQAWMYWLAAYGTIALGMVYIIVSDLLHKPYRPMYGPISILNTTNLLNLRITVIYQEICMFYVGAHYTVVDLIIVGILVHASYQFKILQNNLVRIVGNSYRSMYSHHHVRDIVAFLKLNLKKAVKYHLEIVSLVDKLEYLCNEMFLIQFVMNLVVVCFQIYDATKPSSTTAEALSHIAEMICVVMQSSVLCYWAEQVIYESDNVGRSLFQTDFVGTDLKFQKLMILVMRRTQNLTSVTAGKFKRVRLATLMWPILIPKTNIRQLIVAVNWLRPIGRGTTACRRQAVGKKRYYNEK